MKEPKDFFDDPQLTAYALGELEGDERAAVEAALKTDAAARAAVDEIRATARQLEAALAAEPMPEFRAITAPLAQGAAIIPGRDPRKLAGGPWGKLIRFPQAYYVVAGLAAACFAVMVTLHESQLEEQRKAAIEANKIAERQKVARESGSRRSAVMAKPSPYTQVTFPVPSISTGRIEFQSNALEMAKDDKKAVVVAAIAPKQPANESKAVGGAAVADRSLTPPAVTANKSAMTGRSAALDQPEKEETISMPRFEVSAAPASGYPTSVTVPAFRMPMIVSETNRTAPDIAGVNNGVAYDFPSRATADGVNPEAEADRADRGFLSAAQNPLSTFAPDAGGPGGYGSVRRFLQAGKMPPADAVRIEELVNYFPYAYAAPRDHAPLAATLEVAAAPWAPTHRLVRIGLKAREVAAGGTLVTVAKDVKVQVDFNPAKVQSYRLIGYDGRTLKKEDFNNDAITAGDVGAGHTVTALYEIVPAGVEPPATPGVDALKYQKTEGEGRSAFAEASASAEATADKSADKEARDQKAVNLKSEISNPELLTVKVRYTPPEGGASRRLEFPLTDRGATFAEASMDFKFAAAVAGFGMILRDSPLKGSATLSEVEQWAGQGLGPDAGGYRAEFIGLVHQAEKLKE